MGYFEDKGVIQLTEFVYVGFWRRVWAKILDFFIAAIPGGIAYTFATKTSVKTNSIVPFVIYILLADSIVAYFIVRYGATPGKIILKMKIVNQFGSHLTIFEALRRTLFYAVYLIVLAFVLQQGISAGIDSTEINHFLNNSTGVTSNVLTAIIWFTFIDQFFLLSNKKKRTIHDFLGNSYLIDMRVTKEEEIEGKSVMGENL